MIDNKFNDPVDVNELFSKCMTESVTEKLTARTVAAYITSPFEIYCNNFVSEAEQDEITEYQKSENTTQRKKNKITVNTDKFT